MKRSILWLEKIYQWMMYLYPAPFRDLFADEMRAVFSLQLQEAGSWQNVMSIVLLEMAHFPLSLIREYSAVQRRSLVFADRGGFSVMSQSTSLYRWSLMGSAGLMSVLVTLVILPFVQHGLYQYSAPMIASGAYDPKGFAPFIGDAGENLYVFTILIMAFMPFWSGIAGLVLGVSLVKSWRQLKTHQRLLGTISLVITCSLLIFLFSPPGRIIFGWILD